MPTPLQVSVKEKDVLRMVLDFLHSRDLYLSMRALERESGIVNGLFSEDALFLRQLILDGQWDDVLEFIQPLDSIESFETKKFRYVILKHKLLEMLCMRSEDLQHLQIEFSTEEVVGCLNELEPFCPSKEDYNSLCLLLTLPRLSDHSTYKDWSPSSARVQCFSDIYPLICRYLPVDKNLKETEFKSSSDRLVQLLMKGMLFESCVDFCQQKATSKPVKEVAVGGMLIGNPTDDSDLSLLSWLQSIPQGAFSCPFEQRSLQVDLEKVQKPSTSWSEQIMTPMTPTPGSKSRMVPSPSPSTPTLYRSRPWSANRPLTQSLSTTLESALLNQVRRSDHYQPDGNALSRSYADFHLGETSNSVSMLPTVNEDVEKQPSRPASVASDKIPKGPHIPQQISPRHVNDSYSGELQQNRDQLRKDWQEQERNRQLLQQELIGGGADVRGAGATPLSGRNALDQVTPPESSSLRPATCHSSTPKISNFDPKTTPEPNASPVLPKGEMCLTQQLFRSGQNFDTPSPKVGKTFEIRKEGVHPPDKTYDVNPPKMDNLHDDVSVEVPDVTEDQLEDAGPWQPPAFTPISTLEDVQAIRAVTFDPTGLLYAVGSNSKTLRVCRYSKKGKVSDDDAQQPTVLFKRMRHHKGSIYCIGWSPTGNLIATGSNDKLIKLVQFDVENFNAVGPDTDLTFHDGTVRDLVFQPSSAHGPTLISGGAGDCSIYVTDCQQAQPKQALSGHTGHILSLYSWGEEMLVSGSQDTTVRMWDMRSPRCVQIVGTPGSDTGNGSASAAVSVDRSGRLIASGQEDSTCMLYDIRGGRMLQTYNPHKGEIRSLRFSPKGFFLLSGSYDGNVVMSNLTGNSDFASYPGSGEVRSLRVSSKGFFLLGGSKGESYVMSNLAGDLTRAVDFGVVGQHKDKVIQCRWHPSQPCFISSSADRTVTLWSLQE